MAGASSYDAIGHGYRARRVPDPRIAAAISKALGDARTVVNVGAGAGSYEPRDRPTVAIEPSLVMARQRPETLVPAVRAPAEQLPLADSSVDAAMAVLTVHHWDDQRQGLGEMLRVARRRVVLLTIDVEVEAKLWLLADYMPAVVERDRGRFPAIGDLCGLLGGRTCVTTVPVPRTCSDGFLLSFWSRPESVLDPDARAATSAFALMDAASESSIADALRRDLADGTWDRRNGRLRGLEEYDCGLRLVVADVLE